MSLRFGLLGLLAVRPKSGYDLTKEFESSLRFVWYARHSQIYPELRRLREDGLIDEAERGPRGRTAYAITTAGRAALHDWLIGTEPDRSERDEAYLRLFFLWTLRREEANAYVERELAWHRAGLSTYET